jgi:putative ABC transport system permease protein
MTNHSLMAFVQVEDVEQIPTIQDALSEIGFDSLTLQDQVSSIMGVVDAISGGLILFGGIALVAAVFGIVNTLYMSVQERTREIGLMKALGLGKHKLFSVFCWEAALIGFFGSSFGLIVAMGLGAIINQVASDSFLSAMPGFNLVKFTLFPSLMIIAIIMFIAFLAGTLPARKASKLDPITALRAE